MFSDTTLIVRVTWEDGGDGHYHVGPQCLGNITWPTYVNYMCGSEWGALGLNPATLSFAAVWPGGMLVDFFLSWLSYLYHRIMNWNNACRTLSTEPGMWYKHRLSLRPPNVLWFLYLHCIVLGGTKQAGLKSLVKNICQVAAFTPHLAINVLTPTQLQLG